MYFISSPVRAKVSHPPYIPHYRKQKQHTKIRMPINYENSYYIIFTVPFFISSSLGSDILFRISSSNTLIPTKRSFQFSEPYKTTAEVIHKAVFREMTPQPSYKLPEARGSKFL
jgi:hypothetical protein